MNTKFVILFLGVLGLAAGQAQNAPVRKQPKGQEFVGPADYNCTTNGAFPNNESCEYYYDCWNGQATLGRCTEGYLFDLTYMGCNYPNIVDCGNRTRPNGTTNPNTTTAKPTTSKLPGNGSAEAGGGKFNCPQDSGLFPNPADCYTFYQCFNYNAFLMMCPTSLVFNPKVSNCDYKANVPSCTG